MNKLEQAARQALGLLEDAAEPAATQTKADEGMVAQWDVNALETIAALREALAEQAEQQPVAEWEKLKDPQTLFVNLNRGFPAQLTHDHLLHLLNKTEQAEQEPVAWRAKRPDDSWGYGDAPVPVLPFDTPQKLYAAPVRTKDLTDEEIEKAIVHRTVNWLTNARAVIAADREKNK